MVAIGLVAAVAVLTLAVPSPGQDRPRLPGIVGEDNRVPINSKEWPWSAIGRRPPPALWRERPACELGVPLGGRLAFVAADGTRHTIELSGDAGALAEVRA